MEPLLLAIDAIYGVILSVAAVLAALQSQRDLTIARSLIKIGAILMAVRWGAWAITTDVNWITRGMVGALIGATLFVLVPAAVHWITVRVSHDGSDAVQMAPNVSLQAAQVAEIQRLSEFIGGKDEAALRELFDFPNFLKYNILLSKMFIDKAKLTPQEGASVNEYFSGGKAVLDSTYTVTKRTPAGLITSEFLPNSIALANISKKYIAAKEKLFQFQSSAQMPANIREAI